MTTTQVWCLCATMLERPGALEVGDIWTLDCPTCQRTHLIWRTERGLDWLISEPERAVPAWDS